MSNIFKSEFLNEYFRQALEKEDFTLEDLKVIEYMSIINENPDEFVKINSDDLKILTSLGIKDFCFEGIDFSDVEFGKTNLTSLEISNCKLSNCNLANLQVEKSIALFNDVKLKDNSLNQFSHMTKIEQFYCKDCTISDLMAIKNFGKLKQVNLIRVEGMDNVLESLPITDSLKTIIVNNEDIQDITLLKYYPNLKEIILPETQLDISQLDTLCNLKAKGISIKFDETNIKKELEKRQYNFEQEDIEKIKKILHLPNYIPLNDYELFNRQESEIEKLEIEDVEIFNKIIDNELLSENSVITKLGNIKGIDFVVENLEGLSLEAIKYISENKDKKFRFVTRTLNGIDSKKLEQLSENEENLGFFVQEDLSHFKNKPKVSSYDCQNIKFTDLDELVPYHLKEMKEFISFLEPIKEQTLEAKNDIEKFSIIRKIMLMRSEYDHSGVVNSKEFKEGREIDTRSLKGSFLEGKAVCAGNALGFAIISEYVGLGAKSIGGVSNTNKNSRTLLDSNRNNR